MSVPEVDVPATERLFVRFRPRHYTLKLDVDPSKDDFSGELTIDMALEKPCRDLVLHADGIRVTQARVNGALLQSDRIHIDAAQETVTFKLREELAAGNARVELKYSASFGRQMRGLYVATARFEGREERHAFTQFEPTYARKMLPCVDEPEAKATFDVVVAGPAIWTVLGNTPIRNRVSDGSRQVVSFKTTPKMSTYLLAIAVGRLSSKSLKVGRTKVSVWALPDRLKQAEFALQAAVYSLGWLNRYFNVRYPLEKLDLVAVPEFSAGAMENWGLITFRDVALLADPKLSSGHAFRRVAAIIAHEIVHQWFGNLVTMRWWNDLWLNEAFATWLAFKVIDDWKPRWRMWRSYEERKLTALPIDALRNTRAISSEVRTIGDIEAQFDSLTYQKGGAVLRMIESYIGEKAFREGVRIYMRRHAYGNTEAKDLWDAVEESSREPIGRLANDWLTRPGFPLVSFDGQEFSQHRFSAYGSDGDSTLWTTPVVLRYKMTGESKPRTERLLLTERERREPLPGRGKLEWLYPNAGETGFYRVSLEKRLRTELARVAAKELTPEERAGFLSGAWALTRAGSMKVEELMEVLRGLRGESDWIVLDGARGCLFALHDRVADSQAQRSAAVELAMQLAGPAARKLGWGAISDDDKRLSRASAVSIVVYQSRDKKLIDRASATLDRYLKDPTKVDAALASVVLDIGARMEPDRFDSYVRLLDAAKTPEQRDIVLKALAEFREPQVGKRALELMLTDHVFGQDIWKTIGAALGNPSTQRYAWEFTKERWQDIRNKGGRGVARLIDALAGYWDLEVRREVESFFALPANRIPSADRSLRQTLEFMELGASFTQRARAEWL